jgi:hypothetical protein
MYALLVRLAEAVGRAFSVSIEQSSSGGASSNRSRGRAQKCAYLFVRIRLTMSLR